MIQSEAIIHQLAYLVPLIKQKNQKLDLISTDIKDVESALQEAGLVTTVKVKYMFSDSSPLSYEEYHDRYLFDCATHYLSWAKTGEHKFRLMHSIVHETYALCHEEVQEHGNAQQAKDCIFMIDNPIDQGSLSDGWNKPLIETPFETREKAHKLGLPVFFKKVALAIGADPLK